MGESDTQFHQYVVVMRHGDRLDNFEPLWVTEAAKPWDPPLFEAGKVRAFSTGVEIRDHLDFPIHRVFVSPFLRCVQTASEVISALCAVVDDPVNGSEDPVTIDPSKIKASVEFGLCEMLNRKAIRRNLEPKDGNWDFNKSDLESMLPVGTVDDTTELLYKELPQWEEPVTAARDRYVEVIRALADKYPSENLLLVTHGEGVVVGLSAFLKNVTVGEVKYCAYTYSKRSIVFGENKSFTASEFEVLTKQGQTGVTFSPLNNVDDGNNTI